MDPRRFTYAEYFTQAKSLLRADAERHRRVLEYKSSNPCNGEQDIPTCGPDVPMGMPKFCHPHCSDGYCHLKYMGLTETQAMKVG